MWNAWTFPVLLPAGEKGTTSDGNPIESPFTSVPKGFWWSIVTLVTVGYGEIVPITHLGRAIASMLMVLGAHPFLMMTLCWCEA